MQISKLRLTVAGNELELVGTDLELTIRVRVPAETEGTGSVGKARPGRLGSAGNDGMARSGSAGSFIELPPGLVSNYTSVSFDFWIDVGVNGNWYQGLNSNQAFNLQTSRAARVGEPINEYQWNANANVTYVPAYGKFAGFGDFIFHYDFYVVGGVGAISTRPIAVIDPDYRTFDFKPKVDFRVGGGLRIFFNRWFAAMLEVLPVANEPSTAAMSSARRQE